MSYASTHAHLINELARIETILDGVIAGRDDDPAVTDPQTEIPRTPSPAALSVKIAQPYHEQATEQEDVISERCTETPDSVTLRLRVLETRFDLSRRHLDVLLLALAPDIDNAYKRQYRAIHDSEAVVRPTVGLLTHCFASTDAERFAATELVSPGSPLRDHDLLRLRDPETADSTALDRELVVTDHIRRYLEGHDDLDPAISDLVTRRTPETTTDDLRLDNDLHHRIEALAASDTPGRYYFHGPDGCQKRQAVDALTDDCLQADLGAIIEADCLDRLHREALLQDCPVHLTTVTAAESPSLEGVSETFAALPTDLFLTGTASWTPTDTLSTAIDAIVEFPYPSIQLRQQFWDDHAGDLPAEVDPEAIAGTFRLTQGELDAALATAQSLADGDLTAEDIYQGCRAQSAGELDDLAQHIEPASTWDDIELPEETRHELRIVRSHVGHQARIYSEWGFADQFSRGTGVVALFSGPSGTGKTMAAEILAHDTGMDLYRIDLSSVVSKYIGETEENLEEIFEAAENSNAILLFDEADAVFGDRAEVSDATDRYANAEVNYLLQRIEAYEGVVLLTTNYESNIDSAFSRRIDHTVSFARPEKDTRDAIWQGIFPEDAPLGEIDYDFLSTMEFTGGQIKTVAQTAAILAADDTGRIEMAHLVEAIQLEAESEDTLLDPTDFGEYRRYLDAAGDSQDETETAESPSAVAQTPETVVRSFVEALGTAEQETVEALFHPRAVPELFTQKELLELQADDLAIESEIERIRDDPDRVTVQFVQRRTDTTETFEYELRRDGDAWRVFDFEPIEHGVVDLGR